MFKRIIFIYLILFFGCENKDILDQKALNELDFSKLVIFEEGDSFNSVSQNFRVKFKENDISFNWISRSSDIVLNGEVATINQKYTSFFAVVEVTAKLNNATRVEKLNFRINKQNYWVSNNLEELSTLDSDNSANAITKNFILYTDKYLISKGVKISWQCEPADLVSIDSSGNVTVTLKTYDVSGRLVATFSKPNAMDVVKKFDITIKSGSYVPIWTTDLQNLITFGNAGRDSVNRVRENFTVKTKGDAPNDVVTITWVSDNPSVLFFSGSTANVTRGDDSAVVNLTATFSQPSKTPVEKTLKIIIMEYIPKIVIKEGKTYRLVYYDDFSSQAELEANWDLGNPGMNIPQIGNNGLVAKKYVSPDAQFSGYENEVQKQPTWSPYATMIKDGTLELQAKYYKWDDALGQVDGKYEYGIAGAAHSKRSFPYGVYVAKYKQKRTSNSHWDAYWLDSNQPFSKLYGKKVQNLPKWLNPQVDANGKFVNAVQSTYTLIENTLIQPNWNFTAASWSKDSANNHNGRWYNGEQRYELDGYEWVNGEGQNLVIHCWHWMRGFPGNIVAQPWFVGNVARSQGKVGGFSTTYSQAVNDTGYFTLSILYGSDKIKFYNSGQGDTAIWGREKDANDGYFQKGGGEGSNDCIPWPQDAFNPMQVKFSIEPGQWNDNYSDIYKAFKSGGASYDKIDTMNIDYFAFYVADDAYKEGGGSYIAITDLDNVMQ